MENGSRFVKRNETKPGKRIHTQTPQTNLFNSLINSKAVYFICVSLCAQSARRESCFGHLLKRLRNIIYFIPQTNYNTIYIHRFSWLPVPSVPRLHSTSPPAIAHWLSHRRHSTRQPAARSKVLRIASHLHLPILSLLLSQSLVQSANNLNKSCPRKRQWSIPLLRLVLYLCASSKSGSFCFRILNALRVTSFGLVCDCCWCALPPSIIIIVEDDDVNAIWLFFWQKRCISKHKWMVMII